MKRHHKESENKYQTGRSYLCTINKGLIGNFYKEFLQINKRKTKNPVEKLTTYLNRHFTKKNKGNRVSLISNLRNGN